MRKALIVTILIIAALGTAAWYLANRPGKQDLSPWQFIPAHTLAVLETEQPRLLQRLDADSAGLVSLLLESDSINKAPEPWLFSIQSLGNKTGVVAIIRKTRTSNPLDLAKAIQHATIRERSFQAIQINDVIRNNQPWMSIAHVRGVWIVSPHGLLVEEIIRHIKTENNPTFKKEHGRLFQLSNVKQDDGNLYINWPAFRSATSRGLTEPVLQATQLTDAMLFDLRWTGNGSTLLLNGFATDSLANSSILSIFKSQRPVPFSLRSRLPDQFKYFIHFGISNPSEWLDDRDHYNDQEELASLESKTKFQTDAFFKAIDNEIALCALPSGEHLIIAELKEITRAVGELNKINLAHAKDNQYSHERYANEDVHVLKQSSLSKTLFWPLGFETQELYYTIVDNLLVFCDGETGLKRFIDTIGENTLNKSLEWNKFLESTLQEANVSVFTSSEMESLFGALRQPQKFSMQFYALEGDYYASSVMQFGKSSEKKAIVKNVKKGLDFGQALGAPWTVRNHNDKSTEIIVADASNQVHLVSKDQKVLWSVQLPGPIQGEVYQVDLLKNGKLQYLFLTNGKIHVIDRLGRYVNGYPKNVGMENAVLTSLIDYDRSREYRFLMADATGTIKVSDLDGALLDGWKSKNLPRAFSDAPTHVRIRQRDYYEAVTIEGEIFAFNRRGDIIDGFPLSLNVRPSGDVVSDGKQFVLVSEDGTMIQVSTSGKKVSENALMKKTPKAMFRLVASSTGDDFIVVKSEQGFLAAFDKNGKQLFEINNPASDNLQLRLTNDVLVVFDRDQNIFYACDLTGKLLIPQPLQATGLPAVIAQQKALTFYVPDQTRLVSVSASL
ncbi:MAG TPA: hypothetical protein VFE50_03545 [Cyclobacteriaceae bacterium]|nr:hypothetical protein [Cyclobacteriaceae bacterium]